MRTTLIALPLLLAACGGQQAPDPDAPGSATGLTDPAIVIGRITAQEDSLYAPGKPFDKRGAMSLLDVYGAFVRTFPQDTMAPEYLFRSAGLAKALGEPEQGVKLYDRIITEYPAWKKIPSTYYLKAFTIDDGLKDTAAAHAAYDEVIARFPDHPFARDARAMIENLPYSDEQLIERFQKMQEQGQ